ncbi:phospholipase D [Encephalitozoon hellem ATCC 50504]|uniref:Phospholipase n=1 Tax=Encephalitozoon hellem TaxID=27973 RepID=A0A9Q9CBW8_ENCHE|nr:phospholipase D [Encephalitozoon hellem ATCC 50504]AFM99380.1 phospholipase D [Encephalitozoon hellem ATCC 50504]UTX44387.1 phospholipase D alpha [Encephalitozoon hellem]|eukprot:XP_003888361.1 phospholipase D [Encephalitozoon hellem ATCC 50504]
METTDKTFLGRMPQDSVDGGCAGTLSASESNRMYKNLLESVLMVPFRKLRFLSQEPVFPVLLDYVDVSVDRTSSSSARYTVSLRYGKQRWRIHIGIVQMFSLNAYLHYREVMDSRRDKPDMCAEGHYSGVEEFLRVVLHRSRLLDIGKVYDFFRISRHSFNGTKMFEDKFHVSVLDLEKDRCKWPCCKTSGISGKMYVVCKKSHLVLVDYKNGHKDIDVLFYRERLNAKYKSEMFCSKVTVDRNERRYVIKSFRHDAVRRLFGEILGGLERRGPERFLSFSPVRRGGVVNFYIDGKSYFHNLYETLCLARREVFIAGWWIYPTLYLRKEPDNGELDKTYRLDHVLKKLAEGGIRIKILMYKEALGALNIDSNRTCELLSNLHKRIEVLMHPNNAGYIPIYWTHHEKIVAIDQRIAYVGGMDLAPGRYDTQEHALFSTEYWPEVSGGGRWEGDTGGVRRMPWHDVQCKIVGDSAFDVSQHFIERWNFIVSKYGEVEKIKLLVPNEEMLEEYVSRHGPDGRASIRTQVLRSAGKWSLGYDEDSISRGYSEMILSSKRFIYIENQFFITRCSSAPGFPENTIGKALVERIVRANRDGEEFKVYVVIPLFPILDTGFTVGPTPAMEIIRIQEQSIFRGEMSVYQVLKENGVDPDKYLVFVSLRKAYFDGRKIVQEQIYVHSKIIIVDGTSAIVGSANLNDRSMLGNRDTEIALLVEEESEAVRKLLKRLLEEHLGVRRAREDGYGPEDLLEHSLLNNEIDLGSDDVFNKIIGRARNNTEMFRRLFGGGGGHFDLCSLDDGLICDALNGIQGHLVLFTDDFLAKRQFERSIFSIQGFIPSVVYY